MPISESKKTLTKGKAPKKESVVPPDESSSTKPKRDYPKNRKSPRKKPGPKPMDRDEILEKLKKYLQLDLTIERSCNAYNSAEYELARIEKRKPVFIASRTVHQWAHDDEEFRGKVQFYQDTPNVLSRQVWREKIAKGDYQAAKDWLERKEKNEFSTKTVVEERSTVKIETADIDAMSLDDVAKYIAGKVGK